MKTRSRSAKPQSAKPQSAKDDPARSRRVQRTRSGAEVVPIAVMPTPAFSETVIPVAVNSGNGSAEAVIPVQVPARGGRARKRAAVIPISIQRPAPARQREEVAREYPLPWRTTLAKGMDGVVEIERDVLEMAKVYGQTAVAAVQWLLGPPWMTPAADRDQGKLLPLRANRAAKSRARARAA